MKYNHKIQKILLFLFAVLCLLLPASFITFHILNPSGGARLSTGETLFMPLGAIVSPYFPGSSALREGDVVTEVAGKPMESWAQALFQRGVPRPEPQFGETIKYGVMRDGQRVDVDVFMGRLPVKSILARHWGAMLFAFVTQVVAFFVLVRRSDDPAARALFIWAMSGSHTYAWSFFMQVGDIVGGFSFWLFRLSTPGLWLLYWPAALHVALVFPKPLRLVKRFRWLLPGIYIMSYLLFFGALMAALPGSENVLVWLDFWGPAETLVAAIFLLSTVVTIVWQYRTSSTWSERARIRLVVWGAALTGISGLVLWIIVPTATGISLLNPNLLGVLMLLFPLSMAVAIWRHHFGVVDSRSAPGTPAELR